MALPAPSIRAALPSARKARAGMRIFRMSDTEISLLRKKVEQQVAPEIADARDATLKAMREAEAGWQKAIDNIGQRAGLVKGPDGTWSHPSMVAA